MVKRRVSQVGHLIRVSRQTINAWNRADMTAGKAPAVNEPGQGVRPSGRGRPDQGQAHKQLSMLLSTGHFSVQNDYRVISTTWRPRSDCLMHTGGESLARQR
jgi:hypothetical protein